MRSFRAGRWTDFQGALPESQLKAFVDRLSQLAGGQQSPIDDALAQAKELIEAGDWQSAGGIYSQILQHEPELVEAIAGLARCLMEIGQRRRSPHRAGARARQGSEPSRCRVGPQRAGVGRRRRRMPATLPA